MTFSEYLTATNSWVLSHKELLTVLGVPLLTVLVTLIANAASNKRVTQAQEFDRKQQRLLKISDFRQAWIEELRLDLAYLISLSLAPNDRVQDDQRVKYNAALARVQMRVNPKEDSSKKLMDALNALALRVNGIDDQVTTQEYAPQSSVIEIANDILKFEWERLKQDLDNIGDVKSSRSWKARQ